MSAKEAFDEFCKEHAAHAPEDAVRAVHDAIEELSDERDQLSGELNEQTDMADGFEAGLAEAEKKLEQCVQLKETPAAALIDHIMGREFGYSNFEYMPAVARRRAWEELWKRLYE